MSAGEPTDPPGRPWPGDRMRFGVNYTPRRGWFHSWLDPDPDEIAADLDALAGIGIDHIRIFPLWPLLQPDRGLLRGVDDVATVVELAGNAGLGCFVDVLQGHLSSFDFLPAWVNTWHRRNLFTDPDVVAAQQALVAGVAESIRALPGALGLGLGNEFIQFAAARHPDPSTLTSDQASAWLDRLLGEAQDRWPTGVHTHSFDDDLWFDDSHPFNPSHAVRFGNLTTVHSWIFGSAGRRFGADAEELAWFARWLCELAAGWGPGRGVWLQEVGAPLSHLSRERAPQFLTDTIDILLGARGGGPAPGLGAITWWCSHDVSPDLLDFPAVEYDLGLFDSQGRLKPTGAAYAAAIRRWRDVTPAPNHPGARAAIEVELAPDFGNRSSSSAEGGDFAAWLDTARAGEVRAVHPILAQRSSTPRSLSTH